MNHSRAQQAGQFLREIQNGGLNSHLTLSTIDNQRNAIADSLLHMVSIGGGQLSGEICAWSGQWKTAPANDRLDERMRRPAKTHRIAARRHRIRNLQGLGQHNRQRPRPKRPRQSIRKCRPITGAPPGHLDPVDVNDDGVLCRPAFDCVDAFDRIGIQSVGGKPVHRFRGQSHHLASGQQFYGVRDSHLKQLGRVGWQYVGSGHVAIVRLTIRHNLAQCIVVMEQTLPSLRTSFRLSCAFRSVPCVIQSLTQQLLSGKPLDEAQVADAVQALTREEVAVEEKADFLTALATKGETVEEIAAFARLLRDKSIRPPLDVALRNQEILDVVGTGGDKLRTINISSTAALLCAAAGVTVAKHGNRAVTSKSGSADVLEACGVPIDLKPEEAARALKEQGFAFFFAPHYHPAFKHIAPARKRCAERGQRTIFNFLGPLLNPARPSAMLVGVSRPELCEPFARVLQSLGVRRAMVVCGSVPTGEGTLHMDELSTLGENTLAEFYQERGFSTSTLSPEMFPLKPATLSDLEGGDREQNATMLKAVLSGTDRGPKREAVLLNAAAGLLMAGRAKTLMEGWELAGNVIDSGAASAKLTLLAQAGRT